MEVMIDECPADSVTHDVVVAGNQLPTHVLGLAVAEKIDLLTD